MMALQAQIDAAALEPAGTRPVVHIPKATLTLARTVVVPANKELQIIGDGFSENGMRINNTGGATIALRLDGPAVLCCEIFGVGGGSGEQSSSRTPISRVDGPHRRAGAHSGGTAASTYAAYGVHQRRRDERRHVDRQHRQGQHQERRRPRRAFRSTGQTAPGQVSAFGCHRTAGSCSTSMTEASSWPRLLVRTSALREPLQPRFVWVATVTNMWLAVDKDPAIPLVRVRGHRGAFNILTTSFTAFGESGGQVSGLRSTATARTPRSSRSTTCSGIA